MCVTIIRIRKGLNGHRYSACDRNGYFIGNFEKLSEIRKHWSREIRWGKVALVRELGMDPDMSKMETTKKSVEKYLEAISGKVVQK